MTTQGIEDIVASFETLTPATAGRWNVISVIPERLHISRADDGQYAVFIEGAKESFGKLPSTRGIEHSQEVTALPSSRRFSALRLTCQNEFHGNRVLSHIAYELSRRLHDNPALDNESLFREIEWVLLLLGANDGILTEERQRGLVGECTFLRRLLIQGRKIGVPATAVLGRWWGHHTAKRDFAATGIAVEVKTTSSNSRQHHISSIEQLDAQATTEEVYLFSFGVKSDPSAPKKLTDYVADVEAQLLTMDGKLDDEALAKFRSQLSGYGYDRAQERQYAAAPGYLKPHLAGALFRDSDLRRLRYSSFVDGKLPSMVTAVSYVVNVTSDPLSDEETEEVLRRLLTATTVSFQ